MSGIAISFPGVKALDGVDFRLLPGEVHALMGENGAGKSTLIKVLTGVYAIDSGTITVRGRQQVVRRPGAAQEAGISTVYQEVNLCPNLTVAENILLGREPRRLGAHRLARGAPPRRRAAGPARPGHRSRLAARRRTRIAVQQLVAIARAVDIDAQVLILDEPTSSLDADEVARAVPGHARRCATTGVAILFVSHFLDQVYEISDRMTVLRNGRLVGEYRDRRAARSSSWSRR